MLSQSVDDRTDEEKDVNSSHYIYKSRYSPVYSYLSDNEYIQDFHNDYPKFRIDEEIFKTMIENGIPKRLSEHFCNLMVRDPLVIFDKKIDIEDPNDFSHFENFNSTNWNSLRFKPPRVEDNDSCFKVEVRPCELQLTAFENSAILAFTILYTKILYSNNVNFVIPISMVDQNFEKAYLNDAVSNEKFWFRINSIDKDPKISSIYDHIWLHKHEKIPKSYYNQEEDMKNIKQLTLVEILLGSPEHDYPGLFVLMKRYLEENNYSQQHQETFMKYLKFIELRAKGNWFN